MAANKNTGPGERGRHQELKGAQEKTVRAGERQGVRAGENRTSKRERAKAKNYTSKKIEEG